MLRSQFQTFNYGLIQGISGMCLLTFKCYKNTIHHQHKLIPRRHHITKHKLSNYEHENQIKKRH